MKMLGKDRCMRKVLIHEDEMRGNESDSESDSLQSRYEFGQPNMRHMTTFMSYHETYH